MTTCGAPNPFSDLPPCDRAPHDDDRHEATWTELGGTSHLTWRSAATIREALAPQRERARALDPHREDDT